MRVIRTTYNLLGWSSKYEPLCLEWPAFVSVVWGGKDGKYHHHHSTANDHLHYDHRFGWFSSRFKINLDRGATTMKDTHKDFKKRLVDVLWFFVCQFHPMVVCLCCCHRHAGKTMGMKMTPSSTKLLALGASKFCCFKNAFPPNENSRPFFRPFSG